MKKYSTLVSSSVLALFLATFTLSAQAFDYVQMERGQQELEQQMLQVSDWFQDQGYFRSNLMLAVTGLGFSKQLHADKVIEVLNASINSKQLQKSDWHLLARFCQKAHLKTESIKAENTGNNSTNKFVNWCKKNRIASEYTKNDADNSYAYLFQIDLSADDPYNRDNQRLLEKAAASKYVTDYYGYGLHTYIIHLGEYFRSHQVEPVNMGYGFGTADNAEGMFTHPYLIFAASVSLSYPLGAAGHCGKSQQQLWSSFDDKTVLECIRLMKLFRSDKNTLTDNLLANVIIASLSPPGSEEQLEATRLKNTNQLVYECLTTWGDPANGELASVMQHAVFLKMTQLLESMGEIQAMAVVFDQYYAKRQHKDAPKPSSCLLLKDLSFEAAEKLLAAKK
ncbi:MAG: hypothetical protein L3J22_00150 [Xanthomonadales bacterium]|nr:hypothetical protein [Xanthomonadales bacterium]